MAIQITSSTRDQFVANDIDCVYDNLSGGSISVKVEGTIPSGRKFWLIPPNGKVFTGVFDYFGSGISGTSNTWNVANIATSEGLKAEYTASPTHAGTMRSIRFTLENATTSNPVYTFTQSDLNKLTVNGSITCNGNPITANQVLNELDIIVITSINGYSISSAYFVDGNNTNIPFVMSNQNTVATLQLGSVLLSSFNVNLFIESPVYTITQADIDILGGKAKLLKNNVEVALGTQLFNNDTVAVTANATYKLTNVYFTDVNNALHNFTLSSNDTIATLQLGTDELSSFSATVKKIPDYVITATDINNLASAYVTLYANSIPVYVGMGLNYGDQLLAVCANGREFKLVPLNGIDRPSMWFRARHPVTLQYSYTTFTLTDENRKATLTFAAPSSGDYVDIGAETIQATPMITGKNNVYKIDYTMLTQLNTERFTESTGVDSPVYDYGQFILGLIQLPFAIDNSLLLNPEPIQLATRTLNTVAPLVATDNLILDMGNILVTSDKGNLLDYKNKTCVLHLPYANSINIDPEYVINETINIQYQIDLYTGKATINVSSTKINSTIATVSCDLGIKIPFANLSGEPELSNSNIDIGGNNNITVPFIEVLENEALLIDKMFTIPVIDEKVLNGQKGYIEVENIQLNSTCSFSEKQTIIDLLTTGVIIK